MEVVCSCKDPEKGMGCCNSFGKHFYFCKKCKKPIPEQSQDDKSHGGQTKKRGGNFRRHGG